MRRSETSILFDERHPCLEGHFDGRPIVPAVAILAELAAWIEVETGRCVIGIERARFQASLLPNVRWKVELEERAAGEVRVACSHDGRLAMSAKFAMAHGE